MKEQTSLNALRTNPARGNGQMVRCPHCKQIWLTIGIDHNSSYACRSCRQHFIVAEHLLEQQVAESGVTSTP